VLLLYHYYLLQFKFSQKADLTFTTFRCNQIAFGSRRTLLLMLLLLNHLIQAKPRLLPAQDRAAILSTAGKLQANVP
jgi:hypothetical protein